MSTFARIARLLALAALVPFHSGALADPSLYDALGQKEGISKIVVSLVARVHADPRTTQYFDGVSDKRLTDKLSEQFCQLAGGPCVYTGHSMEQAHGGLQITRAAFDALVEDLQDAMDENRISTAAQNRLLALLAPMAKQIENR